MLFRISRIASVTAVAFAVVAASVPRAHAQARSAAAAGVQSNLQRAVSALRQAAEGVVAPPGAETVLGAHDRAAIASQRLTDVIAALAELPLPAQTTALARLRAGNAFSKGAAQGLHAYRTAKQRAAGDPGKLARSQGALKLGIARLVVDGNAQFAELAEKPPGKQQGKQQGKGAPPEDTEKVLKRAEARKPERWAALKKDLVAFADRLDALKP